MEIFAIGTTGECSELATDYAMTAVDTEDALHVSTITIGRERACAFTVSGRNVLTDSMWRRGADALPIAASE